MARMWISVFQVGLLAWLLAGCGFQLRGEPQLPFAHARIEASEGTALAVLLRHTLASQGKLSTAHQTPEIVIKVQEERRDKSILSLSGGGKVREYRLTYKVGLRVTDSKGKELLAPMNLEQSRDYSYDDALILAKQAEEATLWRGMEQEVLRQALRRLSYLKR